MQSAAIGRGLVVSCFRPTGSVHYLKRQLFTGRSEWASRGKAGWWRKFLSAEAKTTARAYPLETGVQSRWTGKQLPMSLCTLMLVMQVTELVEL